jgi:uncharacterized protein YjbI with pentapeptide repeats
LAAVLADAPIVLIDDTTGDVERAQAERAAQARLIVIAARGPSRLPCVERLEMTPWGDDDLIEYLLATRRDQCQAVMFKVKSYARHLSLDGSPELWRMVLDTMAADETIPDVAAALRRCLAPLLSDPKLDAARSCLTMLRHSRGEHAKFPDRFDAATRRLLRHRPVQLCLASEMIVSHLCDGGGAADLEKPLPQDVIAETARLAGHWQPALAQLTNIAEGDPAEAQGMAASLLLAVRPDWRPARKGWQVLRGAYAAGAHWCGVDLHHAKLDQADLAGADLSEANLRGASAASAVLRQASLRAATLDHISAFGGDLLGAQLAGASADHAQFVSADLRGADLRGASLCGANLTKADLTGASLAAAKLHEAILDAAKVDGADFEGADFRCAVLQDVRLCDANLSGASFYCADLRACDLEGVSCPGANFAGAKLTSCYLTASAMPGADFHRANLRNAGLADVDWEGADLRDADLRGASFHMGSTRSGLVGSAVPCEGSKTGFYTDDFNDRDFKTPEEIRKANLCRADLRGAKVKGVDFYLVDLRGARFTDKQARYFRRCGAILD